MKRPDIKGSNITIPLRQKEYGWGLPKFTYSVTNLLIYLLTYISIIYLNSSLGTKKKLTFHHFIFVLLWEV